MKGYRVVLHGGAKAVLLCLGTSGFMKYGRVIELCCMGMQWCFGPRVLREGGGL